MGSWIETVTGPIDVEELGMILPHEHVFTDLRPHDAPGFGSADVDEVLTVMAPRIAEAKEAGVSAIVECTPLGVGRNVEILRRISEATGFPLVASAGVYRQEYMPDGILDMSEGELMHWLRKEVAEGIEGTDVKGGIIKLAVTDSGITAAEERVLRAAGRVAGEAGVTVASHTGSGELALEEIDVLVSEGLPAERFIWVHAQEEADVGLHRELGSRGCYIEYDGIREGSDLKAYLRRIEEMRSAGLLKRVLLSQDAGWYRPGEPEGGEQVPFDFLPKVFIPYLADNGFSRDEIRLLTEHNPKTALARCIPPHP